MENQQGKGVAKEVHQTCADISAADFQNTVKEVTRSMVCFTVPQVANLMQLSVARVRQLIKSGQLIATTNGSLYRVPAWSLTEHIDTGIERARRMSLARSEVGRRMIEAVRPKGRESLERWWKERAKLRADLSAENQFKENPQNITPSI